MATEKRTVEAHADFTQVEKAYRGLIKELTKVSAAHEKLIGNTKVTNVAIKAHTGTLEKYIDIGKKVVYTMKQNAEGQRVVAAQYKESESQIRRHNEQLRRQQELEAQRAKQARQISNSKAAGLSIGQSIIGKTDLTKGTETERIKLFSEVDKLQTVMAKTGTNWVGAQKIYKNLGNQTEILTGEQLKLYQQMVKVKQATEGIGSAFAKQEARARKATGRVISDLHKQEKQTTKASKAVKTMTLSWDSFARLVAVQLIHQTISRVIIKLQEAAEEAVEFSKRIAEIQTISQKSPLSNEIWFEALRLNSETFGLDIMDQAEAAYQTLSNQIGNTAESIDFLTEANKFAIATNSTVADSVALGTAALNSYGKSAMYANEIFAQLFKTIELGRVRASEMANTLGRLTPLSEALNMPMVDVLAMVDTITISGMKFNEAATQIRGILTKLTKPTPAMQNLFLGLGYKNAEEALAGLGTIGLFKKIQEATGGASDEIAKYMPRIRGAAGLNRLLANDSEHAAKAIKELANAQESYNQAIKETMGSSGKQVERLTNTIRNEFLAAGNSAIKVIGNLTDGFTGMREVIKATAVTLGGLTAFLAGGTLVKFAKLIGISAAGGIGAVGAAGAFGLAALNYVSGKGKERLKQEDDIRKLQLAAFTEIAVLEGSERREQRALDNFEKNNREAIQAAADFVAIGSKGMLMFQEQQKEVFGAMKRLANQGIASTREYVNDLEQSISKLKNTLSSIDTDMQALALDSGKQLFDWALNDDVYDKSTRSRRPKTAQEQERIIRDRIYNLRSQQESAVLAGSKDEFKEISKSIRDLYVNLYQLDVDQSKIDTHRSKIKREYVEAVETEKYYYEQIKESLKIQLSNQEAQLAAEKERLNILEQTVDKLTQMQSVKIFDLDTSGQREYFQTLQHLIDNIYTNVEFSSRAAYDDIMALGNAANDINNIFSELVYKEMGELRKKLIAEHRNAMERHLSDLKITHDEIKREILDGLSEQINAYKALQREIKNTEDVRRRSMGDELFNLPGNNSGGPIFGSGYRDSTTRRLTPGEFVVNKEATSRFYSQLVQMNSQSRTGLNSGGTVTNVGDIHIHPQASGNAQMDIQNIAYGLKREMRRGTVSF
jgi:TP901 family phage tail tape measure protein